MTVHWDSEKDLLDGEKDLIENPKRLKRNPTKCCGNSPGKSHKKFCDLTNANIQKQPDLSYNPVTGKWIKERSYVGIYSEPMIKKKNKSCLKRGCSDGKIYPRNVRNVLNKKNIRF